MMTYKKMDEIYKMAFHKFRPQLIIGVAPPYFGPGPCNLFLESILQGKRLRRCFSPTLPRVDKIPSLFPINIALKASFRLGFYLVKSQPSLQLRVLRLCPTTRPRRHRTPPSLIKLSSFIRNIQIAISVSCLFFICSQETDPRGQVDRSLAWSITSRSWFSDC